MKKVMLVEDEELILKGLSKIIDWDSLGMDVVHMAHNGKEALTLWEKEPVDLVVTDIDMPVMNGMDFLKELRSRDKRVRCIILTGYDEFEYARKAIGLDVEDYILKPIDEDKLEAVVRKSADELNENDRINAVDIDVEAGQMQLLRGELSKEEALNYIDLLPPFTGDRKTAYAAVMKINLDSMKHARITDVLVELQKEKDKLRVIYLSAGSLLLLYYTMEKDNKQVSSYILSLQTRIESDYDIMTFVSVSSSFGDYKELPDRYKEAMKFLKYIMIKGYGSCVLPGFIHNRYSSDIEIDDKKLRKLIFSKDKEGGFNYIEDLFINNIKEDAAVDDIYQMSLQIAMILQEIKKEYKLTEKHNMNNLTEMIEKIFHADDFFTVKTLLIGEMIEIITYLNENNSQYTPVIKQIITEVQKNYMQDMNLKTLANKYHMNASYLGQIFQKEIGCPFAQYLSNTKNGVAKNLILNTNMRITDIAKKVGYSDTSYFYRKFKQCYGVSPASLREMKKY